jgi:hypothetical protein
MPDGQSRRGEASTGLPSVPRAGYTWCVKDTYSFTAEGLQRVLLAGVAPAQVWSALHSDRRLVRQVTQSQVSVFARTSDTGTSYSTGQEREHLVVALEESTVQDNDWDIVGARRMDQQEKAIFDKLTGRMP